MERIASVQNPQIKGVCALHRRKGRQEQGRFLIEGWHLLAEALKRRLAVETVYYVSGADTAGGAGEAGGSDVTSGSHAANESVLLSQASAAGAGLVQVSEQVMRKISTTDTPQGIAAVLWCPEVSRSMTGPGEKDILLILDRIQDPGNLGGILRVALAADVAGVLLTPGCADPYGPKALRGGMGSLFGLQVLTEMDGAECRDFCAWAGTRVVALTPEGKSLFQWLTGAVSAGPTQVDPETGQGTGGRGPLVLILGNEGDGIAPELLAWADERWSLPMYNGVESLNVAVTAGIVLYELRRRQNGRS